MKNARRTSSSRRDAWTSHAGRPVSERQCHGYDHRQRRYGLHLAIQRSSALRLVRRQRLRRVGEVEVTAQITLNGTVHRVEMTARPVSGPRIQPILYRRCAAQNGSLPDTTCGENTSQAVDFHDSTQTYSATTN